MRTIFSGLPFVLHLQTKEMKNTLITSVLIIVSQGLYAQLSSSNLNPPATAQPVPNATATEKSAAPQPQNIAPSANPVPPIYPGAEVQAAEVQRQIINPPVTQSGTQPVQKEPISPIESTNTLQPNRPPREEASRKNAVVNIRTNTNTPVTKPIITTNRTTAVAVRNKTSTTNNSVKRNNTSTKSTVKKCSTNKKSTSVKKKPSKI